MLERLINFSLTQQFLVCFVELAFYKWPTRISLYCMLIYQVAGFSRHHFAGGKNRTRKQGRAIFTIASSGHGAEPIEGYLSVRSSIAEPIGFWLFSDLSATRWRQDSIRAFKSESFSWT